MAELKPGAVCLYREDFIGGPAEHARRRRRSSPCRSSKLVEQAYPPDKTDKGYRDKLRKVVNMVYVGVLASICRIEMDAVEQGDPPRVSRVARRRPARSTSAAAHAGYEWAQANLPTRPAVPGRADGRRPQDKILIEGNKAAALGVLFGGANVLTWYPITPSSSLAEYAEDFLKKHRVDADGTQDASPSCRPRTSWRPSAWPSAPAGPGRGR